MVDVFLEPVAFELQPAEPEVRLIWQRERDSSQPSLSQASRYEDYIEESLLATTLPEPIRLRGVGGTTLFGLTNRFDDNFPSSLIGKVASEEFHSTLHRINGILYKSIPFNLKCLLCGCMCCCCTLGLSLGPVLCLNKRSGDKPRPQTVRSGDETNIGLSFPPKLEFLDETLMDFSLQTRSRIEKFIDSENLRLYNKLGLNVKLHRELCENTNLREYVILIEFLPKLPLYKPD